MGRSERQAWGWSAWALLMLCIGWSALSASLLHNAGDRSAVAGIAILGWAWGITAFVGTLSAPAAARSAVAILALAVAVRAPLIGTPPLLSDDVYRYLFEGRALLAGHNPFTHAPADLIGFFDPLRAKVNHPEVPSIYPPLALGWFALLAVAGGTVWIAQTFAALADLATVGALLCSGERARRGALLFALHPLAALESASGAHIEAPAIALLAWACLLPRAGPGLAVLGAGVKLFPALILPSLVRRAGLRASLVGVGIALVALVALALPVLDAGPALLHAFQNYARHWSFNGFLWPSADRVLGPIGARLALAAIGGVVFLLVSWKLRDRPALAWLALGGTFLALTPTAHPWYALWMLVPALLIGRLSVGLIGVAMLGSYGVLVGYDARTGAWSEPGWLWFVTWLPVVGVVGWEVARAVRSRSRTPPAPIKP